jgi:hypothetical protein
MRRQSMSELIEELFQILLDYAWKVALTVWLIKEMV